MRPGSPALPRVRRSLLPAASLLLALATAPGCVDTTPTSVDAAVKEDTTATGDLSLDTLKSLQIKPKDAVLRITGEKGVSQPYQAIGIFADGSQHDITRQTSFQVASVRVGVFRDHIFFSSLSWGGKSTVTATTSTGMTASTSLTVLLSKKMVASGAPKSAPDDFAKAKDTSGQSPTLVYPPDGVLVPPNLTGLEFQWLRDAGQSLFELRLQNDGTDLRVYTGCAKVESGCGYVPDAATWKVIVDALKGYEAAQVTVRGLNTSTGYAGSASAARKLSVAEEEIKGGLYYWNATPGTVVRYDFGKPNQKAKNFYTRADGGALFCVGCHALSLNGKRMAVALDMPAPAPLKVVDVEQRKNIAGGAANFMAFSPDGKKLITSNGQSMVLHDTDTMKVLQPNPLRAKGTMPDWSPNGELVVYAEPAFTLPIPVGTPGISQGSIKLMAYDKISDSWKSASLTLVASAGENNYYPTFSPDNSWVVFNRSSGESYDAADAALWMVRADGKSTPVELKAANQGSNLCNSWPKFSPFLQKYQGGKLMWVTFSSRRDYGLRIQGKQRAQLWMAAIDPEKGELATDPSYPAFWLPFQDINTGNHIAQWTQEVVRKKCGIDGDCPTGFVCVGGWCDPK